MFRNRFFVLTILVMLVFSFVGPVSPVLAAANPAPHKAAVWQISGNAGTAGVVLTYSDPESKTAIADVNGDYSFSVSDDWTGTVTPSLSGYTFEPSEKSYVSVIAAQTGEDYTAALSATVTPTSTEAETSTVTATLTEAATATMTATSTLTSTSAPTSGKTTTPTKGITPLAKATSIPTQTATPTMLSLLDTGFTKVSPVNGATGTSLSTITLSWTAPTTTPDKYIWCVDTINNNLCDTSGGFSSVYTTSIVVGGNWQPNTTYYWQIEAVYCQDAGCVSKTRVGSNSDAWWSFTTLALTATQTLTPAQTSTSTPTLTNTPTRTNTPTNTVTRTITPTPTPVILTISGNTGLAGVTLNYADVSLKTVKSDGAGNYSLQVHYGWTGYVTVARTGYTFTPQPKGYTNVTTNQTNQNYTPNVTIRTISGNTGAAGVTLFFNDGAPQTVVSDSSGNYSIHVKYNGWTNAVTPFKSGVTFTPANRSYSNLTVNKTGENYTAGTTHLSIGAQDGSILESTETSNTGGSLDSTSNFFSLGDNATNRQYRVILSFDTSSIPDGATVKSGTLKIKQTGTPPAFNPFSVLGSLWADIRQGTFGSSSLELADFNSTPSSSMVGSFGSTPASGWYSLTLNATGRILVNRAGTTQFRLYFGIDDNNNLTGDYMNFISGNYTTSQPQLILTYSTP